MKSLNFWQNNSEILPIEPEKKSAKTSVIRTLINKKNAPCENGQKQPKVYDARHKIALIEMADASRRKGAVMITSILTFFAYYKLNAD